MNPYESPQDLATAYRIGELQAQLNAEHEAVRRAEQANAFLLELLSKHRAQADRDNPDAKLLQQRFEVAEQRIRELEIELRLKDLRLEQKLKSNDEGARKVHTSPPGTILDGTVCASPTEIEAKNTAARLGKCDGSKAVLRTCEAEVSHTPNAISAQIKKLPHKQPRESDIPEAEWMQPVEKIWSKPDGSRAKPQMKRYFTPAAAKEKLETEPESITAADDSLALPRSQVCESEIHAPQPIHPSVAVKSLPTTQPANDPERYGRFERDHPRPPRSHGRPPPNPRPYYAPQFPRQHWSHFPPHFPPPFHHRAPVGDPRLTSYRDLDVPAIPQFGEQQLPASSAHDLPSAGYVEFTEDLYDEQGLSNTDENKKSSEPAAKGHPPNAPIIPASIPAGLTKSIHAQPHWPVFTSALHNRRHVDVTGIPPSTTLPALMAQITGFALLAVTPPRRVVRLVSPMETAVTLAVTLELARGDAAAALVASTAAVPIRVAGGTGIRVSQRHEASAPIERAVGEGVWKKGATRRLLIEGAGAALRVPANLKYQIENCPYLPSKNKEVGGGGDGGNCRLQGPPEFLEDGAIRVTFLDVRDAVVAYRTWMKSPIFRDVGLSYEKEGALPELEEDEKEKEKEEKKEEVKRSDEGNKGIESSGTDSPRSYNALKIANVGSPELEKEEDEGYVAGSSESHETSSARSIPPVPHPDNGVSIEPCQEDMQKEASPDHSPTRRLDPHVFPDEHDVESETTESGEIKDRDDPRPSRRSITRHEAFLNYDGCSDDHDENIECTGAPENEKIKESGHLGRMERVSSIMGQSRWAP